MKKAAAATVILSILVLCSCSAKKEPEQICVNRIFTAKIDIQYNESAFTADFTCDENGCSAVFSYPEEIKGLTVSTDGSQTAYSLGALSFNAEETSEQTQLINAVYSAITTLAQTAQEAEETYILQGAAKHGNYIMNINKNNFTPTFIEYDSIGLTVKFTQST